MIDQSQELWHGPNAPFQIESTIASSEGIYSKKWQGFFPATNFDEDLMKPSKAFLCRTTS